MSDQDNNTIADRFEAYLLGQLDDQAMDRLEHELRNHPQQADDCIEVMATLAMVREQFRDQYQQSDELRKDPTLHDFHDLLSELSAMEAAAEAQTVQWVGQVKTGRPIWQQWPIVIPSGIAALLAIAVVLIVALPTGNTAPTSPQIANDLRDPNEPGPVGPALTDIVATLTAERDAQWGGAASAAPAPGSPLRAGDRLTLTQGFAEITTDEGAVVILEAPATIELLNSDNAIRLHAGKLVGICETASSKGFVVRTPNMVITDLGTRFGVSIDETGNSLAEVFIGSVAVKQTATNPNRPQRPKVLIAGEAFAIGEDGDQLTPDHFGKDTFTALLRQDNGIASTSEDVRVLDEPIDWSKLDDWPASSNVWVYQELGPQQLVQPIDLTLHQTGVLTQFNEQVVPKPLGLVPAGTRVSSYIVFVNNNDHPFFLAEGAIRFRGEILGVIANARDDLRFVQAVSQDPLGSEAAEDIALWIDTSSSHRVKDTLTLSEDRRSLELAFRTAKHPDVVRVIVREPAPDQP